MTPRLLDPDEAATVIGARLEATWAQRVCQELAGREQDPIRCPLRPNVTGKPQVEEVGLDAWNRWKQDWRHTDLSGLTGVDLRLKKISVQGVPTGQPVVLSAIDLEAGIALLVRLGGPDMGPDIDRARRIGLRVRDAGGALTPGRLKALRGLDDADVDVVAEALVWLRGHPDLGEWTIRQLPVPGMDTKWLGRHGGLLRALAGRDVAAEARPRLSVVHLTYVDPDYLASGGRHHDAWTTGDFHEPAYRPSTVLVVENRDCRLWFPPFPGTIVVEGAGRAAASSSGGIDWLVGAEHLVYWGDIDADGFAILDGFRAEMESRGARVDSILMGGAAFARYRELGVNRDVTGEPLRSSSLRLPHLGEDEADCYASVATAGDAAVRRIEQERIPMEDAVEALGRVVRESGE